jgi:DNA repair protein SbcC/Rad50
VPAVRPAGARHGSCMITRLELTNFRRHRHSVIDVDATARLILIEGGNGAGKSTVVEAILWALYGEGRDGRANLDALVRRGGEDEGMQVSVTFTRGERVYVAARSRNRGHSHATLTLDGAVIAALPSTVTAEVTTLLGVDAVGFRLAAYAQQKELDALASLQPARRGQMLARLLGVDAVAAARGDAAGEARAARSALNALGPGEDLEDLDQRVASVQAEHDRYASQVAGLDQQLTAIRTRLAELAEDEASWQEQRRRQLVAVGVADQLETRRRHLRERLASLDADVEAAGGAAADGDDAGQSDEALDVERLAELEAEQERLRDRLATARRDTELVAHRRQLHRDADALHRELTEIIARADTARDAGAQLDILRQQRDELAVMLAAVEGELTVSRDRRSGTQALLEDAEHACVRTDTLGDQCDTCGQAVAESARRQLQAAREAHARELRDADAALSDEVSRLERQVAGLRCQHGDAVEAVADAERVAGQLDELRERETQTLQRRQQLESQVARLPQHAEAIPPLEAALATLEQRLIAARTRREQLVALSQLAAQRQDLDNQLTQVEAELVTLGEQQPDPTLEAAHLEHADAAAEQTRLSELRQRASQSQAVAAERLNGVAAARDGAAARDARRRQLEGEAQLAGAAAAVLDDVSERLAAQIRPALEAEVSQMLDRLSEGRYSAVRLDENYDLWVEDDGGPQPLASLSGGEIDLVALAVRLALAAVVADRHATQGPEFLILDECFGSQDAARQRAIVAALRQLDGVYQQVFVISHVPGVRDEVDRVIEVSSTVEDGVRTAQIA